MYTAKQANLSRADILGFEFEMGIKPALVDEARENGLSLTLRYIPHDVFDRRAVAKGQVKFYEVGYVEVEAVVDQRRRVRVRLQDFGVFYAQEDALAAATGLRKGQSRVVVDGGQVVRVARDRKGALTREVLTRRWADWIDYWAVDFNFESQREILRLADDGKDEQVWSGRYLLKTSGSLSALEKTVT